MKKTIGIIALICIAFSLASCTTLPDPTIAVELYFKSLSDGDSALANQMKEEVTGEYLEDYPGAAQACNDFIEAYLNTFEYEVHGDKTKVDTKAKTAEVYVSYSCVDANAIISEVSGSEELFEYALEHYTDEEALIIFMFELITEKIKSGDWDRVEEDATVELEYDAEQRAWVITNEDDVFGGIA